MWIVDVDEAIGTKTSTPWYKYPIYHIAQSLVFPNRLSLLQILIEADRLLSRICLGKHYFGGIHTTLSGVASALDYTFRHLSLSGTFCLNQLCLLVLTTPSPIVAIHTRHGCC